MNIKNCGEGFGQFNEKKDYYCQFCGKLCHSKNSLKNHECRCKHNPNKKEDTLSNRGWAKGLDKNKDKRIDKRCKTFKKNHILGLHKDMSGENNPSKRPEVKEKISNTLKSLGIGGFTKGGNGRKGWYKGYYCGSSYELIFVIYNIDHNIKFERNKKGYIYYYQGKQHTYYPDFYMINDDSYIEIKGYNSELVQIKLESVKDKPIKCLFWKDIEYMYNYINKTYNKDMSNITDLYDIYYKTGGKNKV